MRIRDVYAFAQVSTAEELHKVYVDEDQRLIHLRLWDYENPDLLTNQIRKMLEEVNLKLLSEEDKVWVKEILWFWYHHAISCAIQKRDKAAARYFAAEAISCQGANHPNKITRLLFLLVGDRFKEAEQWIAGMKEDDDLDTADHVYLEYIRNPLT